MRRTTLTAMLRISSLGNPLPGRGQNQVVAASEAQLLQARPLGGLPLCGVRSCGRVIWAPDGAAGVMACEPSRLVDVEYPIPAEMTRADVDRNHPVAMARLNAYNALGAQDPVLGQRG